MAIEAFSGGRSAVYLGHSSPDPFVRTHKGKGRRGARETEREKNLQRVWDCCVHRRRPLVHRAWFVICLFVSLLACLLLSSVFSDDIAVDASRFR